MIKIILVGNGNAIESNDMRKPTNYRLFSITKSKSLRCSLKKTQLTKLTIRSSNYKKYNLLTIVLRQKINERSY